MGQFVGVQPLVGPRAVAVIGAEDGNPLGLNGDFQVVVGHHDGVAARQRIRPEQIDEQLHHFRLPPEVVAEVALQPRGQGGPYLHRRVGLLDHLLHADL